MDSFRSSDPRRLRGTGIFNRTSIENSNNNNENNNNNHSGAGVYTERVETFRAPQHQDPGRRPPPDPFRGRGRGAGRGGRGFGRGDFRGERGGRGGRGRGRAIDTGLQLLERRRPFFKPSEILGKNFKNLIDDIKKKPIVPISNSIDTEKCLRMIDENDVTFITTDTGTGKSTIIPHAIATRFPDAKILVTEPRRMSAIQLATRVASLLGVELGEEVGYSVRGEHCGVIGETRIMFITSYSLLLYFLREAPVKLPFDFIILDEFHERPLDIQASGLLLRELMRHKNQVLSKDLKLVLSSATVGDDSWKKFFSDFSIGDYSQGKQTFQIEDFYAEDICSLCGDTWTPVVFDDSVGEMLHEVMFRIFMTLEKLAELVSDSSQSILVFLPGRAQVEQLCKWIDETFAHKYYPIMWHGEVELTVIEEALRKDCGSKTKVYLATDIAEVSLTLPDIIFVLDGCMNKRKKINYLDPATLAFPPLKLFWESEANARQRRGRVGRVRKGIYMSMISSEEHNNLSSLSTREYNSGDLDTILLHTLFVTDDPKAFFKRCCEPPNPLLFDYSFAALMSEGYLVSKQSKNFFRGVQNASQRNCFGAYAEHWKKILGVERNAGSNAFGITLKGFITAHVPASLQSNSLVFFGCLVGQLETSVFLAAVAAAMFPFITPFNHNWDVREEMVSNISELMFEHILALELQGTLQNDLLASAHAVLEFMNECTDLQEEEKTAWCEERYLIRSRVVDAVGIYEQMIERLGDFLPIAPVTKESLSNGAEMLHIISIAANVTNAVHVELDERESRQRRYNGCGVVVKFQCGKNDRAPTLCRWKKDDIVLPMTMFPGNDKYLGSFSIECTETQYYMVLLLFSSNIWFAQHNGSFFFRVLKTIDGKNSFVIYIKCEEQLGTFVLLIRNMLCLQLAVLHLAVEEQQVMDQAASQLKGTPTGFDPKWLDDPMAIIKHIPAAIKNVVMETLEDRATRVLSCSIDNSDWVPSSLVHFSVSHD